MKNLPKLNALPKHVLVIPSTGKQVRFRPYLVKEEKVLMMALETQDTQAQINAVLDICQACLQEEVDIKSLPTFDVDYIFTKIRSKSVGEISQLRYPCKACETLNDVDFNLDAVECIVHKQNRNIEIEEGITLTMKYPTYKEMEGVIVEDDEAASALRGVAKTIESIKTEEEVILAKDVSPEELNEFVESMTSNQFEKITQYLTTTPQVKGKLIFDCTSCKDHNEVEVIGLQNFFA